MTPAAYEVGQRVVTVADALAATAAQGVRGEPGLPHPAGTSPTRAGPSARGLVL
jgi:hypothetical protein